MTTLVSLSDMTQELGDKVDSTQESIQELRQGCNALPDPNTLFKVAAVKSEMSVMTQSVLMVHRMYSTTKPRVYSKLKSQFGMRSWTSVLERRPKYLFTRQTNREQHKFCVA